MRYFTLCLSFLSFTAAVIGQGIDFSGEVYLGNTANPANDCQVILYHRSSTTNVNVFIKLAKVTTDPDGEYDLRTDSIDGEFIILAKPSQTDFNNGYLPTYYGDTIFWYHATVLTQEEDEADIRLIQKEFTDGTASISGKMIEGQTWVGKTQDPDEPLNGIDVSLIDKSTNQPIAFDVTKSNTSGMDSGLFVFSNIPNGDYYIYCDVPGIPSDTSWIVKVEDDKSVDNIRITADTSGFSYAITTDIAFVPVNELLSIIPNPFNDYVDISFNLKEGSKIYYKLLNASGQVLSQTTDKDYQIGKYTYHYNLKDLDLPAGIYYLEITTEKNTATHKLLKY